MLSVLNVGTETYITHLHTIKIMQNTYWDILQTPAVKQSKSTEQYVSS